ncbi:MAG TPA: PAS domain S-box protein, partial [Chloroflexaceae bacterium]|nr:PAS domain S-box protein [Chloroflexaceae bacterium]
MDVFPLTSLAAPGADDLTRLLAAHSRDIVFRYRVSPDPGFEYISPACAAITGYAPEAFYARPELASALIYPDDRAICEELYRCGPAPAEARLRWVHRDGRVVWIEQRQQVIRDAAHGRVVVEGSVRDISEYVTAEARLKLLGTALEAAGNAVVIASPAGVIEWVNPAFTRLTGYSAAEAIGQSTRLLRSGRHDERFYRELWATVTAGRAWSGEMINRRKDGSLYHEDQTITPVLNGGAISHFVAIKQDVSARVERERERDALLTMTAALRRARTRAEMLPTLLGQTLVLLRATGAALAMRDPLSDETVFDLGVGSWAFVTGERLPPGASVTGRVIATGAPYSSENIQADPDFVRRDLLGDHRAAACAPLRAHEAVIGALWIACPCSIGPSDLRLLAGIADMAANAIQRTTLFEQTERRLRRLTGLHMIDQAITASLDQRLSLSVVIDQATQQLGVEAADVLLLNKADRTLDYAVG